MRLPLLQNGLQRLFLGVTCLCLLGISLQRGPNLLAEEPKAGATIEGHTQSVESVAFCPDGKTLASCGLDETIRLWDVATGRKRDSFRLPAIIIYVAFSSDAKMLASATDTTIKIWEVATPKERVCLQKHRYKVIRLAFSRDGKTLASGSVDGAVKVWDVATGKERASLLAHTYSVNSLAFTPDGKTLASGGDDKIIKLWDVGAGKLRATLRGHAQSVLSLTFSPDGKTLASACGDQTIKLWDVAPGKERATLQGHRVLVRSLAFSPDGKTLASGNSDNTVRLWDVATGKERATFRGHTCSVLSVAFSPDGKILASGSYDKTIRLWNMPAAKQAGQTASLSSKDLESLWAVLTEDDAAMAYQAIQTLVSAERQSVPLLRERLRPAVGPTAQQIALLIADLDSNRFSVRQKASDDLVKIRDTAASALRKKLAEKPSLELRQRLEQLLNRTEQLTPESLRAMRAVEVLEHIGSPEAKQVLERLATGAEGARLTREAKASLERLKKRAVILRSAETKRR